MAAEGGDRCYKQTRSALLKKIMTIYHFLLCVDNARIGHIMSGANLFKTDSDLSKMHSFFVVHISIYSFVEFLNSEMTKKNRKSWKSRFTLTKREKFERLRFE